MRALQGAIATYIIESEEGDDLFKFTHDRFHHGAMALCRDPEEMHYHIADLMLFDENRPETSVYVHAAHICASSNVIKTQVQNRAAYRLVLLEAADKASDAGGIGAGLEYFKACLHLLQDEPWDDSNPDASYRQTLDLHCKAAESFWISSQDEPAKRLLEAIFEKAQGADAVYDRVPAYVLRSRISTKQADPNTAFSLLKQCLEELGLDVPETSWEENDVKFHKLCEELQQTNMEEQFRRPLSQCKNLNTVASVLAEVLSAAYWISPLIFYRLTLVEFDLHLHRGNTTQAGLVYTHFAAVILGRFPQMLEFGCDVVGQAAERFFEQYSSDHFTVGRGQTLAHLLFGHLRMPMAEVLVRLESALEICLSAGDTFGALLNMGFQAATKVWASQDLSDIEAFCWYAPEELLNWQDDIRGGMFLIATRQFTRALQGKTNVASGLPHEVMCDEHHNSETYLKTICAKSSNPEKLKIGYYGWSLVAKYMFGHYEAVISIADHILDRLNEYWSSRFVALMPFFIDLSYMAAIRENPDRPDKEILLARVKTHKKRFDPWGDWNEANYGIWSHIMAAELYEHDGRFDLSVRNFEQALDIAEIYSLHLDSALASELFAENLIRRGAKRPARSQLLDAIAAYRRVSAFGKAKQVAQKHELLLRGTSSLNTTDFGCQTDLSIEEHHMSEMHEHGPTTPARELASHPHLHASPVGASMQDKAEPGGDSVGLDILDLTSILKSSQLLSSELQVDKLLPKMSQIILDSTGAELSAIVVREEDGTLNVASINDSSGGEYLVGESLEDKENVVAKQILLNCLRFKEMVFLDNVLDDERFSNVPDVYRSRNPGGKAIIAMPILRGDQHALGAVYLEGPPHSFTERNSVVLRLLINSISISITNAMLFKSLEKASAKNAVMVESQKVAVSQARQSESKAKIAEAEAMRNVKLKEEAAKAKSMFLANVSHELRTPLNGVIGMSELLKGSNLTQEQDQYADSIRVCADTLLTVINDILDFSKLEAGKMQMFSVPLSLHETIQEVVRALSFSNMEKHLETLVQLDLDPELLVVGDPVRLHQILMNLMSNAYKFTSEGHVLIKATVDSEDDKQLEVTCCVSDTGVGISEEQKKKLFLPFSQADSSTARSYGGTGLGLSICKAIIENVMNGKIWLESVPGKGTKVFFSLKFVKAPKAPSKADGISPGSSRSPNSKNNADPMAIYSPSTEAEKRLEAPDSPNDLPDIGSIPRDKIRVCVAEDNPINQKIALSFVKKIGFQCEAFADGRQAVDALAKASTDKSPFHVVLMDVQMPVLDGYDATREIRKHSDATVRKVLIIAMTASAIRGDRTKCLEAGMNNYLAVSWTRLVSNGA